MLKIRPKRRQKLWLIPIMLSSLSSCNTTHSDTFNSDGVYFHTNADRDDYDEMEFETSKDKPRNKKQLASHTRTKKMSMAPQHNTLEMYVFPSKLNAKGYSLKFDIQ